MQKKLTHFSSTSVKWLSDLSFILSRNMLPFLMLTFPSLFLERKRGEKPQFISVTATNFLKYTTKQLLQTPIFRYNNVVHCNAVSSLHCITDTSLHQRQLLRTILKGNIRPKIPLARKLVITTPLFQHICSIISDINTDTFSVPKSCSQITLKELLVSSRPVIPEKPQKVQNRLSQHSAAATHTSYLRHGGWFRS